MAHLLPVSLLLLLYLLLHQLLTHLQQHQRCLISPALKRTTATPWTASLVVAMVIHLETDAIATLFLWPWVGNDTAGVQVEVETLTPATQLNVHFRLSACKLTVLQRLISIDINL